MAEPLDLDELAKAYRYFCPKCDCYHWSGCVTDEIMDNLVAELQKTRQLLRAAVEAERGARKELKRVKPIRELIGVEVRHLTNQLAEAREDTERLDWLEHEHSYVGGNYGEPAWSCCRDELGNRQLFHGSNAREAAFAPVISWRTRRSKTS